MRNLVVLALATGALLGSACTNDYDALLDQAVDTTTGATTDGSASSGTDAMASSSAASSTSEASSSVTSSAGGGGQSGVGGEGGAGQGGTGEGGAGQGGTGEGGEGGGAPPSFCERLALDLDDSLGDIEGAGIWSRFASPGVDVDVDTNDHELDVDFSTRDVTQVGGLRALASPAQLGDCRLTATIVDLPEPGELQDTLGGGYIGLSAGAEGKLLFYVGFLRARGQEDVTELLVLRFDADAPNPDGGVGAFVNVVAPIVGAVTLPISLRLDVHESALTVAVAKSNGGFEDITDFDLGELAEPFGAVEFAGSRYSDEGQGQLFEVDFGPFVTED